MSGNVTQVTDATFEATVVNADKPAMVDFWATWCGPCRIIAPHVEALAEEFAGKVIVAKVDVDSSRQTAIKFGIQSIPTLAVLQGRQDGGPGHRRGGQEGPQGEVGRPAVTGVRYGS